MRIYNQFTYLCWLYGRNMAKNKSPRDKKKDKKTEARRALIILVLATAFFVYSLINYFKIEGG